MDQDIVLLSMINAFASIGVVLFLCTYPRAFKSNGSKLHVHVHVHSCATWRLSVPSLGYGYEYYTGYGSSK
jgi:hypothetical protein